jgi:multisubunit Na+/H+ antiporter MnhB subunit
MLENRSKSRDILLSLIIVIVYFVVYFIVFKNINAFSYLDQSNTISVFITIFVTLLGVIAVIMTLFTVFEDTFKNNKAIKILKSSNKEIQLYERYSDSLILIFLSLIILSIIYILVSGNYLSSIGSYYLEVVLGLGLLLIILCFIRVYRCFILFSLLKKAVYK